MAKDVAAITAVMTTVQGAKGPSARKARVAILPLRRPLGNKHGFPLATHEIELPVGRPGPDGSHRWVEVREGLPLHAQDVVCVAHGLVAGLALKGMRPELQELKVLLAHGSAVRLDLLLQLIHDGLRGQLGLELSSTVLDSHLKHLGRG